jgi:hypothetical protein
MVRTPLLHYRQELNLKLVEAVAPVLEPVFRPLRV